MIEVNYIVVLLALGFNSLWVWGLTRWYERRKLHDLLDDLQKVDHILRRQPS